MIEIIASLATTISKSSPLFGYHKDFFTGLSDEYELIFFDDDPDYPAMITTKNFSHIPIIA